LALAGSGTDAHYFLFNDGTGRSSAVGNSTGGSSSGDVEVADLEPDGDLDVISATFGFQAGDITVFRNAGDGAFGVTTSTIQVLLNDGTGVMVQGPTIDPGGTTEFIDAADFDLDGDDDLVWQLRGFALPDAGVALSNGNGTFGSPQLLNVASCETGQVSTADWTATGTPTSSSRTTVRASPGCEVGDRVTIVPNNGDGKIGAAFDVQCRWCRPWRSALT